jgi:hypothetical protein
MTALAATAATAWLLAGGATIACGATLAWAVRLSRPGGDLSEPRRWLHDRVVRRSSLGATLQMVANGLVQVAVPAWLIVDGHLGTGAAAVILMGMTLTMAAMGPVTGRRGSVPYSNRLWRGLSGCATGLIGLGAAAIIGPWWLSVPSLVVLGLGAGSLLSPSLTAFSRSQAGDNAVGLSIFNVLRLGSFGIGGMIGGTAVDLGVTGRAFLSIAGLCGGAAIWVLASPKRTREPTAGDTDHARHDAPVGARGGNDGC